MYQGLVENLTRLPWRDVASKALAERHPIAFSFGDSSGKAATRVRSPWGHGGSRAWSIRSQEQQTPAAMSDGQQSSLAADRVPSRVTVVRG